MTTWTALSNTAVGIGGLPSGATVTALRDNPVAIAEGASGAPRVDLPAIVDALGAVPFNTVGSYAVLLNISDTTVAPGGTIAGSNLVHTWNTATTAGAFSNYQRPASIVYNGAGTAMTGTWRAMTNAPGRYTPAGDSTWFVSLFLRIA